MISFFGENNNYHQVGNGYLEIEITVRKYGFSFTNVDAQGNVDEPIRLVNIEVAYGPSIARL